MKRICIIGAGQLGSRHLQALKFLEEPLKIQVIDPSEESLEVARQRYEATQSASDEHFVEYIQEVPKGNEQVDLAIIATGSNVRKRVLDELLGYNKVKNVILEKLLFQEKDDYFEVEKLLAESNCKAWVNCSMRSMPFYKSTKNNFNKKIQFVVSGSNFGLITNAIHYIDYMCYITGCTDFKLDTSNLSSKLVSSKRKGYLELNGTLDVNFSDGSLGRLICYSDGNAPVQVEVFNEDLRVIVRESEQKAWISKAEDNWIWNEIDSRIPYQSELTTIVVNEILKTGDTTLTKYTESMKIHIQTLEPLREYLEKITEKKFDHYPFT